MPAPKVILTCAPLFWPKLPPLGINFLQSYLEQQQLPVDVLDINNYFYRLAAPALKKEWLKSSHTALETNILTLLHREFAAPFAQLLDRLLAYDVIGFSCYKSNFQTSLALARLLNARKKSLRFIWGGPELQRLYYKTDGRFTDELLALAELIVIGEGELPLAEFLQNINNGMRPGTQNERLALFRELPTLEHLPFPRYTAVNLADYPQAQTIALQFSRGCIRRCQFCSERLLHRHYRSRSVDSLLAEITYHREQHHIKNFIFFDSLINGDLVKLDKFCEQVITRFGGIAWEAQLAIRMDMDDVLLAKMKRSGCYNLFIGLESGAEHTLARMRKGFTAREAGTFFERLHAAGLTFGISLITGYPGETAADFQESLEFLIRHKASIAKIEQVNPFTYYEGTAADRTGDYRLQQTSLARMEHLVGALKQAGFKYTNAFIGNLIEKESSTVTL